MRQLWLLAGLGLALATFQASALEGDVAAGEQSAAVCAACHQADGSGMNISGGESWPRLAGLNADYLYKQLQDFKSGARQNASMTPFVNMLDDTAMKNVALYFSQLPATSAKGGENATAEELALGEQLALHGDWSRYIVPCKSCHGAENEGVGEHFPTIAGQHAGYIAQALKSWQNKSRKNDPQHLMGAIAERLTDQDIKAVSQWLSRQNPQ